MTAPITLGFEHHYAKLPNNFHASVAPAPSANPSLVVLNQPLARELGVDPVLLETHAAAMFSGNALPVDAQPLAMAYAGHQFGSFVPQLGDGRAILLGELRNRAGELRDVHLKGAGRTPYSRNGDGRAALGPMLREYLISEAMHALGIPTTRSLAVVATGEQVHRTVAEPGAILVRVAASHIRVGTFQFFAVRNDLEGIRALLAHVIERHYPHARDAQNPALAVLESVIARQAQLISRWMQVGFIHGVMNTDNMAISGETIDYGPCAFMDHYRAHQVFSSIDHRGRYAYTNQPVIAQWNLARFAETLLPLLHTDQSVAIEMATHAVREFMTQFDLHYLEGMRRKIGLVSAEDGDAELIKQLLTAMQENEADFTLTFRNLVTGQVPFDDWRRDWQARLARDPQAAEQRTALLRATNPAVIPRNHRVDAALTAASAHNDFAPFHHLLSVLQRPCDDQPNAGEYTLPPEPEERVTQTFCGT